MGGSLVLMLALLPAGSAPAAEPDDPPGLGECPFVSTIFIALDHGTARDALEVAEDVGADDDRCATMSVRSADGATVMASEAVGGYKTFTLDSPTFTASDSQGRFTAQVRYANTKLPVQFHFRLSSGLRAVAVGGRTAVGRRTPVNCTYDKRGVGARYEFHWSCSSHSKNTKYDWRGTYAFDVNVGGRTGRAVVTNRFGYVVTTVRG